MIRLPAALAAVSLLCAPATGALAQDVRYLASTCANCHGTDGRLEGVAMPRLAGLPAAYITEQMRAFRDGRRPATIMHQIAKGYTDEQIGRLSSFFEGQAK